MLKNLFYSLISVVLLFSACNIAKIESNNHFEEIIVVLPKKKDLSENLLKKWYEKDIIYDTIPGVSLEKVYENSNLRLIDTTVVAVIDSGLDILHPDLNDKIWINKKEIPENNIDDDGNGYIDDIQGWNFRLSPKKENISYARYEYVRLLKKNDFFSQNGTLIKEKSSDSILSIALKSYKKALKDYKSSKSYLDRYEKKYRAAKENIVLLLKDDSLTIEKLSKVDTVGKPILKRSYSIMYSALKNNWSDQWIDNYRQYLVGISNYKLNPNYIDRVESTLIDKKSKIKLGNNDVKGNLNIESHSTFVSGIILSTKDSIKGMNLSNYIKVMPIRVIPSGDEYDDEVALAIRYAVDNGAKIINMSFGKYFSPNSNLVNEAIMYAAKKDVLIVHASGNDGRNIDKFSFFPNDTDKNREISNNFLNIGASSYDLNKSLVASFTNYGKKNVDVFAPGFRIYTTAPNNSYEYQSGTSIAAPIVSKVAAIIRSSYPSLSAAEVKNIIMVSGTSYNIKVEITDNKDHKMLVPFSELSRSGKIVNAYNALLLAEEVSKNKK